MRSSTVALLLALTLPAVAFAEDEADHENWMEQVDPVEMDDLTISFSGAHAQDTIVQVKIKVVNNGEDYFYFQPSEPVFEVEGEGRQPNDGKAKKAKLIKPRGKLSETLKLKADSGYHVDGYTLTLKGFSKAASDGKPLEAKEFQLPASRNTFDAGPFACSLDNAKLTTGVSTLKFSCRYKGDDVGWIDAREMAIRAPNGQEFANADKKADKQLVGPGDTVSFTGLFKAERKQADGFDMQFDKFDLFWRGTFSESKLKALSPEEVEFTIDEALTAEKNE